MEVFLQFRLQIGFDPPPARFGQRPLEYLTAEFRPLLAWRFARASLAAESSCPTTCDSRACRDCFPNLSQTPQSIDHRHQLLPGSLSPVCTHPKSIVWEYSTASPYPKGSSRFRLTFL